MLAYQLLGSGSRCSIGPRILVSALPQGVKGVRHRLPETNMKPSKEITARSAKRAGVEAEEPIADDIVQGDRLSEVCAVVVGSYSGGGVGALWRVGTRRGSIQVGGQ